MRRRIASKTKLFLTSLFCIVLVFSAVIFWPSRVSGATVGTASLISSTNNNRTVVVTSGGTFVAFWDAVSVNPTGLVYSTSTDSGANWSAAAQVTTNDVTGSGSDFSVAIDSSDNIFVVYTNVGVYSRKMTYSAGSWSIGSPVAIYTGSGTYPYHPSIAINSSGYLVAGYAYLNPSPIYIQYSLSNGGASWSSGSTIAAWSGTYPSSLASDGTNFWTVDEFGHNLMKATGNSATFSTVATLPSTSSAHSLSYGLGAVQMLYKDSVNGISYQSYNGSSLSSPTQLSAATSDVPGMIVSSSSKLWATWQSYVGANSYNIVYKSYDGATWDSSPTSITTDNLNNVYPAVPVTISGSTIPVVWIVGTSSPYRVKEANISAGSSNSAPAAPTLSLPASGATNQSTLPQFQLRTTDTDSDYLQYDIVLYQSDCSTQVRDIDQTSDQTGWMGQDKQTGSAYTGSSVIAGSTMAIHNYQFSPSPLSPNTTYCWKAKATDPGGTNTWSSYSATQNFTTATIETQIQGGTEIRGGTSIGN